MMSRYREENMRRIPIAILQDLLERMFQAAGCSPHNATIMAEGAIEADLRGHYVQGTDHIFSTLRDLRKGILKGKAEPVIARQTAATALVDGHGVPGHVGGRFATDLAVRKAREAGTASIGLLDSGDIFMLGYYASAIAEAGLVGFVLTNSWPPRVHPYGGIDRVLGTNPLAIGVPARGEDPVVLDLATSVSAVSHVRIANYYSDPIPPGVAIDGDGNPTTDAGVALEGVLSPLGGHKGFGLGLCVALLSGPLVGGVLGEALERVAGAGDESAGARGHLFMAVDPAAFGDPEKTLAGVSTYLEEIRASRKAPGIDKILIPGERSFDHRRRNLKEGVPILDEVWNRTAELAAGLGVEMPTID
jgi:LDH2 family malate/lactate/ureidoglycolate dehydrogenase